MTLYLHGAVAISPSVSKDNHIKFDLCQAEYF
ncbi:hypothetical protein SAMN05878482_101732 [Peribacillus simplex]|uniref:Uncharacterized protein n=1 Tax=Peribacillus simplex TaxID=1478 RepID=A0A9X8WHU8_9BACI|nr:hypothetical protein SAMN05878482_101732 [Peribacillus simplex]